MAPQRCSCGSDLAAIFVRHRHLDHPPDGHLPTCLRAQSLRLADAPRPLRLPVEHRPVRLLRADGHPLPAGARHLLAEEDDRPAGVGRKRRRGASRSCCG